MLPTTETAGKMENSQDLYEEEEIVKQGLLEQVRNLSHVELKKFNKAEYKKKTHKELCKSLPKYEKGKLSETAQCIANALQSEVEEQLRKRSRECTPSRANFLSETITNELQTTLHLDNTNDGNQIPNEELIFSEASEDEDTVEDDTHDPNDDIRDINDSITLMKQIASNNSEINKNAKTKKVNNENTKEIKLCCDSCQINPNARKQYDMIRCALCIIWFHEKCVGIGKDEPVDLWVCETCRSIPQTVKDDVIYLKNDVEPLKESTDTILSAVYGLSTQLENCFSGFQDQITALSRQIKCRDEVSGNFNKYNKCSKISF